MPQYGTEVGAGVPVARAIVNECAGSAFSPVDDVTVTAPPEEMRLRSPCVSATECVCPATTDDRYETPAAGGELKSATGTHSVCECDSTTLDVDATPLQLVPPVDVGE
jgi:hypothetical protein